MERRYFLALGAGSILNAQSRGLPSVARRYADPATELDVLRLTDPAYDSILPPPHQRCISRRQGFCVFSSARGGTLQVYRMDLRGFEWRILTNSAAIDPASVALTADERSIVFFDGPVLKMAALGGGQERTIYRVPEGSVRGAGSALTEDGARVIFVERTAAKWLLRAVSLARGKQAGDATTLMETDQPIADPLPRGRTGQVLYRSGEQLRLTLANGTAANVPAGAGSRFGAAHWAPNGATIQALLVPEDVRQLITLHEIKPENGEDQLIAKTSNYADCRPNADSSVFVGASRNLSAPYVLLLLRVTRRELTLCEHKASDAAKVAARFSPDSQSVFFQSDRHGKMAIYRMPVERFVEETDPGVEG